MSKIDSAYQYYLANYGSREVSRYDSHKKSELRDVYNRIVKTNKESPLYKLSRPDDAKRYAIDIKENAKQIQNIVASLSDNTDGSAKNAFQKKVAVSSDDETVDVKYIGDGTEDATTEQFDIEVKELAKPQINTGNYLDTQSVSIMPGAYSFDLNMPSGSYEFQYNVNVGDTLYDVQDKLKRLVNNSNLGLNADIVTNNKGQTALQISSKQTGLSDNEDSLFEIHPGTSNESIKAMDILGINQVSQNASNSQFLLNNMERSSFSNTFSINHTFELTLKQPSKEGTASTVGFKANVDAVADNIASLANAYNSILDLSSKYENSENGQGRLLYNDMSGLSRNHKSELESIGLMVGEQGEITIDKELLADAITPEREKDTFALLAQFKDAIGSKAENAALNPMNYVDKVVVSYKNPGHNFATPYISSIYSGMMLDNYV